MHEHERWYDAPVGWSQYTGRLEAQRRRSARDEARWAKEAEKQSRALAKAQSQDAAARQVAEYESYVEQLVSLHTECGDAWDWRAAAISRAPEAPQRSSTHEQHARDAKAAYRPGLFERMTGAADRRADELDTEIRRATVADEASFQHALEKHEAARRDWLELKAVAAGMVAGDPASFRDALSRTRAFDAIENFDVSVRIGDVDSTLIVVWCDVNDSETVPTDEIKLTASAKLSSKALPASRYWSLFQDHVCSCALRVAREVFAVLPIRAAIVNVSLARLNAATGHSERHPILSAAEKEQERDQRARLKEEEKARAELERAQASLEKERAHYQAALDAVRGSGDAAAAAEIETKLTTVVQALQGVVDRAANVRAGYVYVVSNIGSFGEQVVKIGMTRRLDPLDRVRELGDASVPFRFDVHAIIFSDDAVSLESELHREFAAHRVNQVNLHREYFYVSPLQVKDALLRLKGSLLSFVEAAEALEWHQSENLRRPST